jgi:large subunit ribosomal protein L28
MAHRCEISGVSRQHGHRVSHANNKRKHVFHANLQSKRIFVSELNRHVRVKLTARMIKTIDKVGLNAALAKNGMTVADLL